MRSLFAWLMFAGREMQSFEVKDGEVVGQVWRYPLPGVVRTFVSVVASMGLCLLAAHYWASRVEPCFGRITKAIEDEMFGRRGEAPKTVLPVRKE